MSYRKSMKKSMVNVSTGGFVVVTTIGSFDGSTGVCVVVITVTVDKSAGGCVVVSMTGTIDGSTGARAVRTGVVSTWT